MEILLDPVRFEVEVVQPSQAQAQESSSPDPDPDPDPDPKTEMQPISQPLSIGRFLETTN